MAIASIWVAYDIADGTARAARVLEREFPCVYRVMRECPGDGSGAESRRAAAK